MTVFNPSVMLFIVLLFGFCRRNTAIIALYIHKKYIDYKYFYFKNETGQVSFHEYFTKIQLGINDSFIPSIFL